MFIDILLLAVWGGVAYFVAADGAIGAVTTFFCVVLGGLVAMNFFEPLAAALDGALGERADVVALLGLFAALVTGMRLLACERIAPRMLELPTITYEVFRWGGGLATGYVTMAILLVAVHVLAAAAGVPGLPAGAEQPVRGRRPGPPLAGLHAVRLAEARSPRGAGTSWWTGRGGT